MSANRGFSRRDPRPPVQRLPAGINLSLQSGPYPLAMTGRLLLRFIGWEPLLELRKAPFRS
jgi:hypothetical protein